MTDIQQGSRLVTVGLTALAITAFAGNSVLTRAAFTMASVDPAMFAGTRLAAGAAVLAIVQYGRHSPILPRSGDAFSILFLAVYAVAFTFAYVSLGTATGALIVFASVQLTIFGVTLTQGGILRRRDFAGLLVAMAGLLILLAPGLATPPLPATILMIVAGAAWGGYTLLARGVVDPVAHTARNFIGTVPLALLLLVISSGPTDWRALILAMASGALTSSGGYVAWYAVVPRLSPASAGTAQLLVPAIAATAGAFWLGETLSSRLVIAFAITLAGVALTVAPSPADRRGK